jgi:hypothetical protein
MTPRRAQRAALIAGTDQHAGVLAGDDRGMYGDDKPAGVGARKQHGLGQSESQSLVQFYLPRCSAMGCG